MNMHDHVISMMTRPRMVVAQFDAAMSSTTAWRWWGLSYAVFAAVMLLSVFVPGMAEYSSGPDDISWQNEIAIFLFSLGVTLATYLVLAWWSSRHSLVPYVYLIAVSTFVGVVVQVGVVAIIGLGLLLGIKLSVLAGLAAVLTTLTVVYLMAVIVIASSELFQLRIAKVLIANFAVVIPAMIVLSYFYVVTPL